MGVRSRRYPKKYNYILSLTSLIAHFRRNPNESKLELKKMKKRMGQVKNQPHPKIPKTCLEVQQMFQNPEIFNKYGSTLDHASALYIDTVVTKDYSFCLFASQATINIVRRSINPCDRHYLIDGTFKVVPRGFYQLIIISIEYKNDVSV